MLKFLQYFKESKGNKIKREEYDETRRSGNIEKKIFVIFFDRISKTKYKEKKTHGY